MSKVAAPWELFERLQSLFPTAIEIVKQQEKPCVLIVHPQPVGEIPQIHEFWYEAEVEWPEGVTCWPPIKSEWRLAQPSDLDDDKYPMMTSFATYSSSGSLRIHGRLVGYSEGKFVVRTSRCGILEIDAGDCYVPVGRDRIGNESTGAKDDYWWAIEKLTRALGELEPGSELRGPENTANRIIKWLSGYKEELEAAKKEIDHLRATERSHEAFNKSDYWIWQGDGTDSLKSLVCSVLILPQDLLAIIRRAERAEAMVAINDAVRGRFRDILGDRLISGSWEDIWENVRAVVKGDLAASYKAQLDANQIELDKLRDLLIWRRKGNNDNDGA